MVWPVTTEHITLFTLIIEQIEERNKSGSLVDSLEGTDITETLLVVDNTEAGPGNVNKPESETQCNTALVSDSNRKAASKPVQTRDGSRLVETSFAGCSHLHSYYCCNENHCTNISKTENERIKHITRDKFQHHWIFDKELSYCKKTGFYWLVFEEGNGMFCLLCRKHDCSNPQNKTKKFNLNASVRYKR